MEAPPGSPGGVCHIGSKPQLASSSSRNLENNPLGESRDSGWRSLAPPAAHQVDVAAEAFLEAFKKVPFEERLGHARTYYSQVFLYSLAKFLNGLVRSHRHLEIAKAIVTRRFECPTLVSS
jgi:hypothetical protein